MSENKKKCKKSAVIQMANKVPTEKSCEEHRQGA